MRRRGRRAEAGRTPSPRTADPEAPGLGSAPTLADLAPGESAEVVGVSDDGAPRTARRLVELGFAPGVRVEVVRQAPLRTPVLYRVQGYEISLRRTEAERILIIDGSQR